MEPFFQHSYMALPTKLNFLGSLTKPGPRLTMTVPLYCNLEMSLLLKTQLDAERVLRQFFNNIGVKFIFLPKYSTDMNPVEFAFNFIRTMLKSDE